MALFGTQKIRELEDENLRLDLENTDLQIQIGKLKHQRLMRAFELEKEIIDKLELSDEQVTELKFIFLMERAQALGIPENEMLHTHEEITKFFMSEES